MPRITTLLLDRDGTLIKDKHYLSKPGGVALLPEVAKTLHSLGQKGMRFFVVSNQSGIGRGMFTREDAEAVNARMTELFAAHGVAFEDIVYCPHAPEEGCKCRKPATGMWERLKKQYGLVPEEVLMVGDKGEDMAFAHNAGFALRALVMTGKGWDVAEKLGIAVPKRSLNPFVKKKLMVVDAPSSPQHPHLVLSSFGQIESALQLLALRPGWSCGA